MVSEAYLPEIEGRKDLEIQEGPADMRFDLDGNLFPVAAVPATSDLLEKV